MFKKAIPVSVYELKVPSVIVGYHEEEENDSKFDLAIAIEFSRYIMIPKMN
jgi:hypothetical protein